MDTPPLEGMVRLPDVEVTLGDIHYCSRCYGYGWVAEKRDTCRACKGAKALFPGSKLIVEIHGKNDLRDCFDITAKPVGIWEAECNPYRSWVTQKLYGPKTLEVAIIKAAQTALVHARTVGVLLWSTGLVYSSLKITSPVVWPEHWPVGKPNRYEPEQVLFASLDLPVTPMFDLCSRD